MLKTPLQQRRICLDDRSQFSTRAAQNVKANGECSDNTSKLTPQRLPPHLLPGFIRTLPECDAQYLTSLLDRWKKKAVLQQLVSCLFGQHFKAHSWHKDLRIMHNYVHDTKCNQFWPNSKAGLQVSFADPNMQWKKYIQNGWKVLNNEKYQNKKSQIHFTK